MLKIVTSFALLTMFVACSNSGGGNGGTADPPPPSSVSFTPSELSGIYTAGTWTELVFQATISRDIPDTASVLLKDPAGVITPDATLVQSMSGTYDIHVKTSPLVLPGRYRGKLEMHLCKDQWCTEEYAGSPAKLPYDIVVSRPPVKILFVPSSLASAYFNGSPATLIFSALTNSTFNGTINVSFVDHGDIFAPDFEITANPDGSFTVLASTVSNAALGHHQGTIEMRLCVDLGCSSQLPGSPASLPYDVEVVPSSPVSIAFSPTVLSGRYVAGDSIDESFTATITGSLAQSTYTKIVDATGILMSNPSVTTSAAGAFRVSARTSSSVLPGRYQGTVEFHICLDAACNIPYPGSPGQLPYDITVIPETNLTPLSVLAGAGDWETYQKNAAHTGYVPVTLDPDHFSPRWSKTVSDSGNTLSPVVAANGMVYATSSGYYRPSSKLLALTEEDGSIPWQYDFGTTPGLNPPAVSGGKVFMATSGYTTSFMWAFPADTGTPIAFKTPFNSQLEHYFAPTIDDGVVYSNGGTYGGMYAYTIADGTIKWFTSLAQYDQWTPAVDANYAYAFAGTGLSIISKATGSLVKRIAYPGGTIYGSPVIGTNAIFSLNYKSTNTNNVLISFSTNTINWTVNGHFPTDPAIANGVLYLANKSPYRLEARNETSGALLWSWTPDGIGETDFYGNVIITDNLVFLSTNKRLYAVSLSTHLPVWSYGKPGSMAISSNGILYITTYNAGGDSDGGLSSVNLK